MNKKMYVVLLLLLLTTVPSFAEGGDQPDSDQSSFTFTLVPDTGQEGTVFELTLANAGNEPLSFDFPTSQKYEITVFNASKKKVYQYSDGKLFSQAFETLELKPHEIVSWKEGWDYNQNGKRVKAGEYTVVAKLKAIALNGKPIKEKTSLIDSKKLDVAEENPVFRNITTEGSKGKYTVKGEARPIRGRFYYSAEDGHNELVSQTEVSAKSKYPVWTEFTINLIIPEKNLPQNGSIILNLYEMDQEGNVIHSYPVLLERFGQ